MKSMLFLADSNLNGNQYRIGEELRFTTEFSTSARSKNKWYLPEDMVRAIVENGTAVVIDRDCYANERRSAIASFYDQTDSINSKFAKGLISDTELLLAMQQNVTNALECLHNVETKTEFDNDQKRLQVEKLRDKQRLEKTGFTETERDLLIHALIDLPTYLADKVEKILLKD